MYIPRQEALLVLTLVALGVCAWVIVHAFRTRSQGFSVRFQIFSAVAVVTLVVTMGFGTIVVDRFQARSYLFAHQAAADDARIVATLIERSMALTSVSLKRGAAALAQAKMLYAFTDELRDTRVQLIDKEGQVIFDTLEGGTPLELNEAVEVQHALAGEKLDRVRALAGDAVAAAIPIRGRASLLPGTRDIIGAVRVTKSVSNMRTALSDLSPKVTLLALILVTAAAGAGLYIGRTVSTPLEELTEAANRVAHGERQAELPLPRGREVRRLTEAFGHMRSELEERAQLEALATHLSHELKNPVAAIRASAEVLDDAIDHDPVAARRFANRILEASDRLGNLIGDLLDLTRIEAKGLADGSEPLVPAEIVAEAVRATTDSSNRIDADLEAAQLRGSRKWTLRAVANLIDNALNYAPPSSLVQVRGRSEAGTYRLSVVDGGPGVPESVRERVFERFITTRAEAGGTGLGLAIVRAVAEAHGGQAGLKQTPGRTEFFIVFPLA